MFGDPHLNSKKVQSLKDILKEDNYKVNSLPQIIIKDLMLLN